MLKTDNHQILEQIGVLWEPPGAKSNNELYHFISGKAIDISTLYMVSVGYIDLVGNAYGFEFYRK